MAKDSLLRKRRQKRQRRAQDQDTQRNRCSLQRIYRVVREIARFGPYSCWPRHPFFRIKCSQLEYQRRLLSSTKLGRVLSSKIQQTDAQAFCGPHDKARAALSLHEYQAESAPVSSRTGLVEHSSSRLDESGVRVVVAVALQSVERRELATCIALWDLETTLLKSAPAKPLPDCRDVSVRRETRQSRRGRS